MSLVSNNHYQAIPDPQDNSLGAHGPHGEAHAQNHNEQVGAQNAARRALPAVGPQAEPQFPAWYQNAWAILNDAAENDVDRYVLRVFEVNFAPIMALSQFFARCFQCFRHN